MKNALRSTLHRHLASYQLELARNFALLVFVSHRFLLVFVSPCSYDVVHSTFTFAFNAKVTSKAC